MNFLERALATVRMGVPVIRLRPKSKVALDSNWPALATQDESVLRKWGAETPEANCASVAKAELGGVWFLEIDDPSVPSRIQNESGQKIPLTYRVRSRPGRGHYYWKQTAESIALGNVAQGYVKNGDFSVRVDAEYVVAAGSVHPISGQEYEVVCDQPIIEAPPWLIEWIKSQRTIDKKADASITGDKIPYGQHDSQLTRIAGKLRHDGMELGSLKDALVEICEKRCEGYGTDYREMCEKIAHSVCRYPVGKDDTVLVGGVPAGSAAPRTAYGVQPAPATVEALERPVINTPPYPVFPKHVMAGTSIYEGLVKPFCEANSRQEEFMFMPALALLLNCIATKVQVKGKLLIPSIFMVMIGKRGEMMKSASAESAIDYFRQSGLIAHGNDAMENANGRSLVWEIGSPEGFGLQMARLKCSNGILYYDELSALTNKAGIDGSSLNSRLLTMYESGKFQNVIKSRKESFSFEPNTYCVTLIACCTDKNFLTHWAKLSGKSSGLDDRFFFLFQPRNLKERTPYVHVNTYEGSIQTRRLIDNAVKQGIFEFENSSPFFKRGDLGNREEIRAEKFALGLAIDLGLQEIDLECIERGLALVDYEQAVKKWLCTYEAITKEGGLQMEIKNLLARNEGVLAERDVKREVHAERYGTSLWSQAYVGMQKNGIIRVEGTGRKGDPKVVVLLEPLEDEDDR